MISVGLIFLADIKRRNGTIPTGAARIQHIGIMDGFTCSACRGDRRCFVDRHIAQLAKRGLMSPPDRLPRMRAGRQLHAAPNRPAVQKSGTFFFGFPE